MIPLRYIKRIERMYHAGTLQLLTGAVVVASSLPLFFYHKSVFEALFAIGTFLVLSGTQKKVNAMDISPATATADAAAAAAAAAATRSVRGHGNNHGNEDNDNSGEDFGNDNYGADDTIELQPLTAAGGNN